MVSLSFCFKFQILACCVLCFLQWTHASTPNTIITIQGLENKEWLTKRALFGSEEAITGRLVHAPNNDEWLCEYYNAYRNFTITPVKPPQGETWVMMAKRGLCSFERKSYAAQAVYGVSGILVYDNLSARYQWNLEKEKVMWPEDQTHYECSNGYGTISNIELDPPAYNATVLDPIMDMRLPTSECTLEQTREPCDSQLCLVTGPAKDNSSQYPVCCAWDLPVTMGKDEVNPPPGKIDAVSVFLTIRQGEDILPYIGGVVTVKPRPYTPFNASQIFLWIMGVLITWGASYFASSDLRVFRAKLARYQATKKSQESKSPADRDEEAGRRPTKRSTSIDTAEFEDMILGIDDLESVDNDEAMASGNDEESTPAALPAVAQNKSSAGKTEEHVGREKTKIGKKTKQKKEKEVWSLHSLPPKGKENDRGKVWTLYSLPPPERKQKPKQQKKRQRPGYKAEVTMETNILPSDGGGQPVPEPWATPIGGFDMTHWHVLGFVVLASFMLFMLFYFQFYSVVFVLYGIGCAGSVSHLIFGPILVRLVPKFGDAVVKELNKSVLCGLNGFDVTSQLLGYIWAIVWIWYGMTHYRPSTNAFFWITINIFGACFCILALSMMKLSNIKIASMLLIAVFFYDIFFVFITPLFLDGESIMITVAKGGGGETVGDDFCYKYPEDKKFCTGIDFLPMLLVVPRFNDYRDGSALLGLGDIVLPGYLIAFCARLDEAKRIVGKHTSKEVDYTEKWYQGYFFWLMIAYGIGLALAFAAFAISGVGQPALLYLVPCCLGMICVVGRKELKDLWTGSRAIRLALKLKDQCERAWGKEKMRRDVAKAKRDRGEDDEPPQPHLTTRNSSAGRGSRDAAAGVRVDPTRSRSGRNTGTDISRDISTRSSLPPSDFAIEENGRSSHPEDTDVCFGDPKSVGVKHVRTVIRKDLKPNPDLEFGPVVFKAVQKRLSGKRYFVSNGSNGWREATPKETKREIAKIFRSEKARIS